ASPWFVVIEAVRERRAAPRALLSQPECKKASCASTSLSDRPAVVVDAPQNVCMIRRRRVDRAEQGSDLMSDNAATIRGVYDAFLRGDITAVVTAMDEQIEWNEAEHVPWWRGVPFVGPHPVRPGVFPRLPQDFDNFRIE